MTYAVIMAGGVGERFWPRSRVKTPKQLLNLSNPDKSLIQETCDRLEPLVKKENIFIVTNKDQVSGLKEVLLNEKPPLSPLSGGYIKDEHIIAEPVGKNTAPCIGLASMFIKKEDPDADIIVLPADHRICDMENFHNDLNKALVSAAEGNLVTIGITPIRPETEYGYIEAGEKSGKGEFFKVKSFKEKPDKKKAQEFLDAGNFLWNSGIFIWNVKTILKGIEKNMPELYNGLLKIEEFIYTEKQDKVIDEIYNKLEKISIDYGVIEKSENISVVKSTFDWDDLGMWTAMQRVYDKDEKDNIKMSGDSIMIDSKDNIVCSDAGVIGVVGLDDIIVVRSGDAVLVCKKDRAKDVKRIVNELKAAQELNKYL